MRLPAWTDRIAVPGSRLLSELLIVVIGVLIALWADSLWSNRHDRAEELQILNAVQEDVDATVLLVQVTIERVENNIHNLELLSQGSAGPAGNRDAAALAELLNSLWDLPPVSVRMSAYDEIQDSGRLRLIADPGLRRLLAHYRQAYEYLRVAHLDAFEHQHSNLDSYLLLNVQMSQLSRYALARDAGPSPDQVEPLPPLQDHRELLDDTAFQNQVAAKFYLLSYYRQQARELLTLLRELDAAILRRKSKLAGDPGPPVAS